MSLDTQHSPSQFVGRMKKVAELISQARDLTSQGPLDYYLEKLVEHSEALLTRFTPIKKGEKAVIVGKVPCDEGWKHQKKTLAMGAVGTIVEVDYRAGRFSFLWVPDQEWWQDNDGKYHQSLRPHSFCLDEKYLAKMTELVT